MTKNTLIKGAVAFSFLALVSGAVIAAKSANAAGTTTPPGLARGHWQMNVNLTAAQKAAIEAKQEANLKIREARQTAIKAALTNNDYSAWVTAVGTSSPLLKKITAGNFSQYVQAFNLRQQAETIMTSLGLGGRGEGLGLGLGMEFGHGGQR